MRYKTAIVPYGVHPVTFAADIEKALNELSESEYRILSVVAVNGASGQTEAALIVGEKRRAIDWDR